MNQVIGVGRPGLPAPTADRKYRLLAACRDEDPNLFFPLEYTLGRSAKRSQERGLSETAMQAMEICRRCPVDDLCLEYAIAMPGAIAGIWAGRTPHQIAKIKRTRRARE